MIKLRQPAYLILILASLQLLSTTFLLRIESLQSVSSLLFLLSGIAISYFILKIPSLKIERTSLLNKQLIPKLAVVILLLPLSYYFASHIMDSTPIDKEYADMLPVIRIMCRRFMDGHWQQVYEPMPEIWNGIYPNYLPAMWMPFISSFIFHFDMRWITVCGIWLSILLCIWPLWKKNIFSVLYGLGLLILLAWLHRDSTNNVIRLTEEGVVFFYYSLAVVAILSGNPWLMGLSAALCLLSRYAIIGWIPFAFLYLLARRQYGYLIKTLITGAVVVLLLLILPFGIKPLSFQWRLPSQYTSHAARIWNENPDYFYHSPGMAKFFGPAHIDLLHKILIAGSFIVPLLFFFMVRKKSIDHRLVLLSCLQLCVTFFYCFIDVSYLYLYYTPVFTSLVIAGWLMATCKRSDK